MVLSIVVTRGLCILFLLLISVRKRTSLMRSVVFFRGLSVREKTPHFSPTSTEGARKKRMHKPYVGTSETVSSQIKMLLKEPF